VGVRKSAHFLQNVERVLSNNTAELTGIAEAILFALQELRKPNPPNIKELMIRPDSAYAEYGIGGEFTPTLKLIM
jgi:ribonuclease HI